MCSLHIFFSQINVFLISITLYCNTITLTKKTKWDLRTSAISQQQMKFPLFTGDVFSIGINVRTGQDHLKLQCFLHANVTFPSSFLLSCMLMWTYVYKSFKYFPSWLYIEFSTLFTSKTCLFCTEMEIILKLSFTELWHNGISSVKNLRWDSNLFLLFITLDIFLRGRWHPGVISEPKRLRIEF